MRQALHIFWKDVRLYWIEIVGTLAVTALFVWTYPMGWSDGRPALVWPWVPNTIAVLLPVTWFVLITRVVHAESLVGERQFWITRPYRWPQLLAAKALFLGIVLYVPFLLAQCILLREAGMHPMAYLVGLFFNLLLATGIVVLPMACLAAVTSNFAKTLLAVLCLFLFSGGVAYLDSMLPTSASTDSSSDVLSYVLAVSVFIAVLVIQYARRWTGLSYTLLIVLAVTFSIVGLFGLDSFTLAAGYPIRSSTTGPRLAFGQVPATGSLRSSAPLEESREVTIALPVAISDIAPLTAVKVDDARVSITAAGGARWSSHWQDTVLTLLPGQKSQLVNLKINRAFYERMKDKPATVEMSVALTMLKSGAVTRTTLPNGRFEIPGGSLCRASGVWRSDITCLSPMRQPPLTLIAARFTTEDCSAAPPSNDGDLGIGWIGALDSQPADFGLTSVWESTAWFQRFASARSSQQQHLCPGSPITFAQYTVASRDQQTFSSQPLTLKSLRPLDSD